MAQGPLAGYTLSHALVTGTTKAKQGHTDYTIEVGLTHPDSETLSGQWTLRRRFRQFDALLARLRPYLPQGGMVLRLPPKNE